MKVARRALGPAYANLQGRCYGAAARVLQWHAVYVKGQGVPTNIETAQAWFNRAVANPAADQTTRDDAKYNADLIAKRLAREASEKTRDAPSPYDKISFLDLALDGLKLQPGQKVEMTGNLETELSGSMVFLYNHEISTRSTAARIFRQIVVTSLSLADRAYILERCGGSSGCRATVRGTFSQYGGIIANSIEYK
jgi:hypothetical protein